MTLNEQIHAADEAASWARVQTTEALLGPARTRAKCLRAARKALKQADTAAQSALMMLARGEGEEATR